MILRMMAARRRAVIARNEKIQGSYSIKHIPVSYSVNILRSNIQLDTTRDIPHVIYQTWKTLHLSPQMHNSVESLKIKHPLFEHKLFDDAMCREFIKTYFIDDVLDAYDSLLPGAFKADLWRYCVMYIKGGVYLDIKYNTVGNVRLDSFMDKDTYVLENIAFTSAHKCNGIYNALLISKPGNEAYLKAITHIINNVKLKFRGATAIHCTGPALLGLYISSEKCRLYYNGHRIVDRSSNISLFEEYKGYRNINNVSTPTHYHSMWTRNNIYANLHNKFKMTDIVTLEALPSITVDKIPYKLFTHWSTQLSHEMSEMISTIRDKEPCLDVLVYDNNMCLDMLRRHFTLNVVNAYTKLNVEEYKSDIWRYACLYLYGGIYFDINFKAVAPFTFSSLIDNNTDIYVKDENTFCTEGIYNRFICLKPRNPYMLELLWNCCNNILSNSCTESSPTITGSCLYGAVAYNNVLCSMVLKNIDSMSEIHHNNTCILHS